MRIENIQMGTSPIRERMIVSFRVFVVDFSTVEISIAVTTSAQFHKETSELFHKSLGSPPLGSVRHASGFLLTALSNARRAAFLVSALSREGARPIKRYSEVIAPENHVTDGLGG